MWADCYNRLRDWWSLNYDTGRLPLSPIFKPFNALYSEPASILVIWETVVWVSERILLGLPYKGGRPTLPCLKVLTLHRLCLEEDITGWVLQSGCPLPSKNLKWHTWQAYTIHIGVVPIIPVPKLSWLRRGRGMGPQLFFNLYVSFKVFRVQFLLKILIILNFDVIYL